MTEKELREQLNNYLAPAGLPECRRQKLLGQIRSEQPLTAQKGEPHMYRPGKRHIGMLLTAVLVLLSVTIALATGLSGYVNIKGEPVEAPVRAGNFPAPTATSTADPDDPRAVMKRLIDESPDDVLTVVSFVHSGGRDNAASPIRTQLTALDQLADYLPEGAPVPRAPEGFSFYGGSMMLVCADEYELVSKTTHPSGVVEYTYRIPEGQAVLQHASITFWDGQDGGSAFACSISLNPVYDGKYPANDGAKVEVVSLPGMDDALVICDAELNSLFARVVLDPPLTARGLPHNPEIWGNHYAEPDVCDELVYSVLLWSDIPAETAISLFK